jgi:hypothetical protein
MMCHPQDGENRIMSEKFLRTNTTSGVSSEQASQIPASDLVEQILSALRDIRFGSVEIIVHDARVVQIERKEK